MTYSMANIKCKDESEGSSRIVRWIVQDNPVNSKLTFTENIKENGFELDFKFCLSCSCNGPFKYLLLWCLWVFCWLYYAILIYYLNNLIPALISWKLVWQKVVSLSCIYVMDNTPHKECIVKSQGKWNLSMSYKQIKTKMSGPLCLIFLLSDCNMHHRMSMQNLSQN